LKEPSSTAKSCSIDHKSCAKVQVVVVRQLWESQDEWERRLREAASDCGVSLSDEALSSEGLYD
jgi:hypothetical protein